MQTAPEFHPKKTEKVGRSAADTQLFSVPEAQICCTTCASEQGLQTQKPKNKERGGHLLIFLLGATVYQRPQRASGLICTFKLRVIATAVLPERPGETPQTLRTALKT